MAKKLVIHDYREESHQKRTKNVPIGEPEIKSYRDRVEEARLQGKDVTPWTLMKKREDMYKSETQSNKNTSAFWEYLGLIIIIVWIISLYSQIDSYKKQISQLTTENTAQSNQIKSLLARPTPTPEVIYDTQTLQAPKKSFTLYDYGNYLQGSDGTVCYKYSNYLQCN